jgi:HPP family protein
VWAPVAVALLTLAVGVPALLVGMQPWLLPSLGPTAFLQVMMPAQPSSRLYNVVVGHAGGLVAGFAGVALFNAWNDPVVLTDHQLTAGRLAASTVAMALSILLGVLLRAAHPPAAATVLLVSLGSLREPQQVIAFAIGLAIIAVVGEIVRRLRLGEWSWGRSKVPQRMSNTG